MSENLCQPCVSNCGEFIANCGICNISSCREQPLTFVLYSHNTVNYINTFEINSSPSSVRKLHQSVLK